MDFKDWKTQNQDPLKHWLSKLSKEQLLLLEKEKNRFNSFIDDFTQIARDELQIRIDQHISFDAQKNLLDKRHGKIINQDDYNPHYREIIDKETNLINNDLYPEFIMSFGVIGLSSQWVIEENEVRALDYFRDIVTLNIIEFLRRQIEDIEIYGDPRFKDVPHWQRVLAKLVNRFDTNLKPTSKFTVIHLWMRENKLLKNVDATVFRSFVQANYKKQLENKAFRNFSRIELDHPKYLENERQLDQIYKSK